MAVSREDADVALASGRWRDAMQLFSRLHSSGKYDQDGEFLGSYALACFEAEEFLDACKWADEAIKLKMERPLYIRGSARFEIAVQRPCLRLQELVQARHDLQRAVSISVMDSRTTKRLKDCKGLIADISRNPPDLFPRELRRAETQPAVMRSRRKHAFLTCEFDIVEGSSGRALIEEWKSKCQHSASSVAVEYCEPLGDLVDETGELLGPVCATCTDDNISGCDLNDLVAIWTCGQTAQKHREKFKLRRLKDIVSWYLDEGRYLGRGPSSDDFCLKEPNEPGSSNSFVSFDANTFWSTAIMSSCIGTTGIKLMDDDIARLKVDGIADEDLIPCSKQGNAGVGHCPPSSADLHRLAVETKEAGNSLFKQKKWQGAIDQYELAIEHILLVESYSSGEGKEVLSSLHANIAQCYLNLELYRRAIDSATVCLRLDPDNLKALFRRALAYEEVGEVKEALADLDAILRREPLHKQAKAAHTQLIVRQAATEAEGGAPAWFQGLSVRDRYEWFVDCYRLRLHDDCAAGENVPSSPRGIYTPKAEKSSVLEDWLVFCKLSALCSILPKDWDWRACLEVASQPLGSCWGTDEADRNASAPKLQQMRAVGQRLYGDASRTRAIRDDAKPRLKAGDASVFDDFGGAAMWQRLLRRLPEPAEALESAELADFENGF